MTEAGDASKGSAIPNKPTLAVLALGTFAIGTDGFIVGGILSKIAAAMHVSVSAAGQLVTIFALVYAVGAPVLSVVTGRIPRRTLLVGSMAVFVAANLLGAAAPAYWVIVLARVLAAIGAAAFLGPATAVAASVVSARHRGRAIAIIAGGLSVATAFGVPLGTLVGYAGSWRLTLVLVAVLAAATAGGIAVALPPVPEPPIVGLGVRLRLGARPAVLLALMGNVFAVAGSYAIYIYVAPLTARQTPITGAGLTIVLLAWGMAAVLGNVLGGRSSDRRGPGTVFRDGVLGVAATAVGIGLLTALAPANRAATAAGFVALIVALSVCCWAVQPAQAHRVVELAPDAPPVAVSLNSSATYIGLSLGGALGGLAIAAWSTRALGWVAAVLEAAALATFLAAGRVSSIGAIPEPAAVPEGESAPS